MCKNYFSVLLDESTDIGDKKSLCILVRYIDSSNLNVKTRILQLVEINGLNLGASELYSIFTKCLKKIHNSLNNILGNYETIGI